MAITDGRWSLRRAADLGAVDAERQNPIEQVRILDAVVQGGLIRPAIRLLGERGAVIWGHAGDVVVFESTVYPGATELKEGENNVADTLAKNMEQDAALRQALKTGGKTEQKGFQLSAETNWDQIKAFYDKELPTKGWANGLGGIANSFIDVNAVLDSANQGNDLFKTAIYSKDKQTLTVVMMTDPTDQTKKQLLFSLSTQ